MGNCLQTRQATKEFSNIQDLKDSEKKCRRKVVRKDSERVIVDGVNHSNPNIESSASGEVGEKRMVAASETDLSRVQNSAEPANLSTTANASESHLHRTNSSIVRGGHKHFGSHDGNTGAWMKYINPSKPEGDITGDNDTGSSFGETWDPALFDRRDSPPPSKSLHYMDDGNSSRKYGVPNIPLPGGRKSCNKYRIERWPSNESLPLTANAKVPRISTSILGFSSLRGDAGDTMEWFRNGELESPQPNLNNFLIKGKQRPLRNGELNDNNADVPKRLSSLTSKDGCNPNKDGWLRYTLFVHQEKSDAITFYSTFRKLKHIFLALEARTGCEIRLSKRLFVHRGKYVRTVVIDGPSRQQILKCHSSLPKLLTELMILECERPSMTEPKYFDRSMSDSTPSAIPAMFQKTPLVI